MNIYELDSAERFLIEAIREFRFLRAYGYECSGYSNLGREYSVSFENHSRSIKIIWQETQDLNVKFQKKSFWSAPKYLDKLGVKRLPTSMKTLAKLIQSDYMHLIA